MRVGPISNGRQVAAGNPHAPLMILWIEEVAGAPADTLVILDECSQEPLANQTFRIEFSPALDQDLTWDPLHGYSDPSRSPIPIDSGH